MAAKPTVPASERISASFKQLVEAAPELNSASDELAKAIGPIDIALKGLNLGVTSWHPYWSSDDTHGYCSQRRIGYAKVSGRWGLALSTLSWNDFGPDDSDEEEWLFNDAPRSMRIEAVDHLPELLEALVGQVRGVAADLQRKSQQARELATTISSLAKNAQGSR